MMLAASRGKGQANSDSTTYNNSHVSAGNAVNITSGADTNVIGGNVKANRVTANVGGNLNIESLQDTATSLNQPTSLIDSSFPHPRRYLMQVHFIFHFSHAFTPFFCCCFRVDQPFGLGCAGFGRVERVGQGRRSHLLLRQRGGHARARVAFCMGVDRFAQG